MRLLTDRHHADLLYSIQRLFEDRLGIDVYIPVGREWWDAEYWRFGEGYGDDRLVRQFLETNESWEVMSEGVYRTFDASSHPDRPIYGVTLEAFRASEWAYVMPSVPDNLPGYRWLATETGAKLLYHVGNTGQWVDWGYEPLVISTSHSAPAEDGRCVVVHQEIDSDPGGAFSWRDPEECDPYTVRSCLNNFHLLPGFHAMLWAERELAPTAWTFTYHGHEGRDGFLSPVASLGDAMASASFGWHDKPVGDGFGHVVHAWAAVGRPLVGHGRYYQGTMAETFWQDGITCLDLESRPLEDTVRVMQEIARDPERHREMCLAIRHEFDRLVDYEAEAASVDELIRA